MARLMVRSKSSTRLRETSQTSKTTKGVSNETGRPGLSPPLPTQSRLASPSSTPSFEVLSRPKTANAAMEEARKRNLMAMGDPISVTDGKETFNFPTPVLLSRYAAPPRPNMERSNTPDTIGIALGSPSHLVQFEDQISPSIHDRLYVSSKEVTPAVTPRLDGREQKFDEPQASKPKISRWKSIFGRKAQQPSLKSQDERSPATSVPRSGLGVKSYHTWEQNSPRSPRMRSDTVPRYDGSPQAPPKSPRWNLGRSQTAPTGRRSGDSPASPPKDFLAVDIPETKMERYSIMFNEILPSQPGGLLARRQSKREVSKLEEPVGMIEDLEIPVMPKRSNTDATAVASPSYRLMVFPPNQQTSSPKALGHKISLLHRPRPKPLTRSNTAPGALSPGLRNKMHPLSPMSETFEPETPPRTIPSTKVTRTKEEEDDDEAMQSLTPTPSEPSSPTTPEDNKPIPGFLPFQNDHAQKSSTSLNTWEDKALMSEPDWEMITIGKVAEAGDRFSDAQQIRVVEEPSPIDGRGPREAQWHPLRMHSSVDKSKASAAASRHQTKQKIERKASLPALPTLPASKLRGMSNTSHKAADLRATMATQRLPGKAEVQVARSVSVTKGSARPVLRTSPRGVERGKGENLVARKTMTPMVVQNPAPSKGHKPAKSCAASIISQ